MDLTAAWPRGLVSEDVPSVSAGGFRKKGERFMSNTTKMLGGWGWVAALVLGFFGWLLPGLGGILSIAGLVCVFIAMMRAGRELNRLEITNKLIVALVLSVVSGVVFTFFVGASLIALLANHGNAAGVTGFGLGMILGGLMAWAAYIGASWFWYQACVAIGDAGNAPMLKTGGLLSFIGALTVVVFGIGGLIGLVGGILQAVGFFTAPEGKPAVSAVTNG
ncbi:MAG: DUF996 domain-containing protein [Gammaproteobacteria bacterium]|nr:DUF996 domain-containing protein [Gammaproteobacteria bacterium]